MELFVNDLTVIDCSLLHPERGLVGESWIVDLILGGELDSQSMLLDFGLVKKQIKSIIDELVDHRLVVPRLQSLIHIEPEPVDGANQPRYWVHQKGSQPLHVHAPEEEFAFIDANEISTQQVATYLEQQIQAHLPGNLSMLSLRLRSEQIDEPFYHYSHGLKKHDGNCQRIAHGHRSRVKVFVDGQLDRELQKYWADRWQDIYLVSQEDLVEPSQLSAKGRTLWQPGYLATRYISQQGLFELLLPRLRCDVLQTDTTVECLTQFMAEESAKMRPGSSVTAQGYEGVGKGARFTVGPGQN